MFFLIYGDTRCFNYISVHIHIYHENYQIVLHYLEVFQVEMNTKHSSDMTNQNSYRWICVFVIYHTASKKSIPERFEHEMP